MRSNSSQQRQQANGDLSFQSTSSFSSTSFRPTFTELSHLLISRGFLNSPLDVSSLPQAHLDILSDLLNSLLSQRDEDLDFRESLVGANRALTSSLDRSNKFLKEEKAKRLDEEKKGMKERVKAESLSASLTSEQQSHKVTKEELSKARRELTFLRISSTQSKLSSERTSERIRSRLAELTNGNLRGLTPQVRIVDGSFGSTGIGSRIGSSSSIENDQIKELERKREDLLNQNQALKRIASDSMNSLREVKYRLEGLNWSEEIELQNLGSKENPSSSRNGLRSSQRVSSSSSSSSINGKGSSSSDPPIKPQTLNQRELFPPTFPLTTSHAINSTSSHPATKTLAQLLISIEKNSETLQKLRDEKKEMTAKIQEIEKEKRDEELFKRELEKEEKRIREDEEMGRNWGSEKMGKILKERSRGKEVEKSQGKEKGKEVEDDKGETQVNQKALESIRKRLEETSQKLADTEVILEERNEELEGLKANEQALKEELEALKVREEEREQERREQDLERERKLEEDEGIRLELFREEQEKEAMKFERSEWEMSKGKGKAKDLRSDDAEMVDSELVQDRVGSQPSSSNQVIESQVQGLDEMKVARKPRKSRLHSILIEKPIRRTEGQMEVDNQEIEEPQLEDVQPNRPSRRSSRLSGGDQSSDPIVRAIPSRRSLITSTASKPLGREDDLEKLSQVRRERREAMAASSSSAAFSSSIRDRGTKRRENEETANPSSSSSSSSSISKKQRITSSPPPPMPSSSNLNLRNATNHELPTTTQSVSDSTTTVKLGPRALAKARSEAISREKAAIASGDLPPSHKAQNPALLNRKLVSATGKGSGKTSGVGGGLKTRR